GHDKGESSPMSQRAKPPFRADHVGSLLRTAPLKEARARREKNEISADELKAIEDREIAAIIKKREDIGLQAVTATGTSRTLCSTRLTGTAIPWKTTTIGPADSSRCASSLRTKRWCSASLPRNRGGLNPRTISSAASTRPQNTWHWSKYVYRRNAASLPRRRAIFSPKKSNGPNSG